MSTSLPNRGGVVNRRIGSHGCVFEARHNYVRKCAEQARTCFMDGDTVKIDGLVVAGLANFKHELLESGLLDVRLRNILVTTVDTSHGMRQGLSEAIDATRNQIANSEYRDTRDNISRYMQLVAEESPIAIYGEREVQFALDAGVVDVLIVRRGHILIDTPGCIVVDDIDALSRQFLGMGGVGAILRFAIQIPDTDGIDDIDDTDE